MGTPAMYMMYMYVGSVITGSRHISDKQHDKSGLSMEGRLYVTNHASKQVSLNRFTMFTGSSGPVCHVYSRSRLQHLSGEIIAAGP